MAHRDAIMDTSFDDAGLPGGDERLFSFKRTIGSILESAGATNDQASREAFVQTMLASFAVNDGFALNPDAGVLMPLDDRAGERLQLTAANLLDETRVQGMKPLACSIASIWRQQTSATAASTGSSTAKRTRMFQLPEPLLADLRGLRAQSGSGRGRGGCRPITEFWAGLSGIGDDTEIAKRLSAFFYEGKTDPSLTEADIGGPWSTTRTTVATATAAKCAAIYSCSIPGNCASG